MSTVAMSCLCEAAPELTGSNLGGSALLQPGKLRALSILTVLEESYRWEHRVFRPLNNLTLVTEGLGSIGI